MHSTLQVWIIVSSSGAKQKKKVWSRCERVLCWRSLLPSGGKYIYVFILLSAIKGRWISVFVKGTCESWARLRVHSVYIRLGVYEYYQCISLFHLCLVKTYFFLSVDAPSVNIDFNFSFFLSLIQAPCWSFLCSNMPSITTLPQREYIWIKTF